MLTAEQHQARKFKFTASVAPIVMSGEDVALLSLWAQLTGQAEAPDFTDNWPVKLGEHLESFILDWHARKTGQQLVERGRVVQHPTMDFIACTLDAWRPLDNCTLDVKVCNAWRPLDEIISYYTPQCLVQKACRSAARSALLIMHGSAEPREFEITADRDYENEMWSRISAFWLCVETLTPPIPLPKRVPPEQWRSINLDDPLDTLPNWAPEAIRHVLDWARTKDAADENDKAATDLKALLPDDVGRVTCLGVAVRRDRRGYLSIRKGQI